jgi:hypothetical protein
VEKTENADFTDFQTRILSYNQRESALPKYPFNQRSTKLFQEPKLIALKIRKQRVRNLEFELRNLLIVD